MEIVIVLIILAAAVVYLAGILKKKTHENGKCVSCEKCGDCPLREERGGES